MVIKTGVRVIIKLLATRGPLSSSTATASETDSDFLTLAVHELIMKPITSWLVVIDAKLNQHKYLHKTSALNK